MSDAVDMMGSDGAWTETARVIAVEGRAVCIAAKARNAQATRAAMCLVSPEPGDRVLVAWAREECFVVGVLERAASGPVEIAIEPGATLTTRGRLTVDAERLELTGRERLTAAAGRIEVHARAGSLAVRTMELFSEVIEGRAHALRFCLEQVDTVLGSVRQRVQRSLRIVDEMDQLRAEHFDYQAKQLGRVHAGDAVVTADRLVKLDGEQVHIG